MSKKKNELVINSQTLHSDLIACKSAFDKVGIPWVIMGGIVLGYARYKEIMDWDTDLDIGVFVEINNKQWQNLRNSLYGKGFRIKKHKTDFTYGTRMTPFNMWLFHKKGNFYEAFPTSIPEFKLVEKAIWYDNPQMVDFLFDKYPMPNHMDDYLICQYGEDWKTNIIKDHEQYFIDKRGGRGTATLTTGRTSKYGDLWPKTLKVNDTMEGV